jgi:short-subunit dehydrogenase
MEVNFFGVINTTQRFLPALVASSGQIVVLSSICGIAPLIGRTGYCASKYALHGYFDTLRSELLHQGVSILLVCPSFVDTSFATRGLAGDGQRLSFDRSTLGVPMQPAAIARAIMRACQQRKRILVFSWRGMLTYYLTRLAPSLYDRLMRRSFDVELKRSPRRDHS